MLGVGGKSGVVQKIVKRRPLRCAVIELGGYKDAKTFLKSIKAHCRYAKGSKGMKKGDAIEVSPDLGKGKSFSKKHGESWPKYRDAIKAKNYSNQKGKVEEPDWWYISGHHADWSDNRYYAKDGDIGFFNGPYHHYHEIVRSPKVIKGAVYITTSVDDNSAFKRTNSDLLDGQVKPHPLYEKGKNDNCIGLFLIGCHTISDKEERLMLQKYFPKAVVFGYFHCKAPAKTANNVKNIFKSTKKSAPSFFEDPDNFIKNVQTIEELVGMISRRTKHRQIGIYYKKTLYVPKYNWKEKKDWDVSEIDHDSSEKVVFCKVPGK